MHFNCQLLVLFCHWLWFQCNVIVFTHELIQLFNLQELTSLVQNMCVSVLSPLTKAVARGSFKLWTIIGALHCEFSRSYPNKSGPWVAERSCRVALISQSSQNVWTILDAFKMETWLVRRTCCLWYWTPRCWNMPAQLAILPNAGVWDLRRCEAAASLIYHWELPSTTSYVIPHLQQRANRKTATSIWTTQRVWPSWLFCHAHLTPLWHSNS